MIYGHHLLLLMEVVAEVDGVFDAIVDHRWLSLTNTHWVMGQSAAPTDEMQPPNRGALASNTHKHTSTHTHARALPPIY